MSSINILPDEELHVRISVPNNKKIYETIEKDFICPTKCEVNFQGIIIKKILIELKLPDVIIGEKSILPQIVITTESYKPWYGNIGLAWEGLINKTDIGFFPFENEVSMETDILKYSNENIVDPICDFLNNYKTSDTDKLRESISKFIGKKTSKTYWMYSNPYKKKEYNSISVPITMNYFKSENKSKISFNFFTVGSVQDWPSLSKIVLGILLPLSSTTSYFDGENIIPEEKILKKSEIKAKSEEIQLSKAEIRRNIEKAKDWNPFQKEKALKRDEFGFIMDRRSNQSEFGTKDTSSSRKNILTTQEQVDNLAKKESDEHPPTLQDTSQWNNNVKQWYNDLQYKEFTVVGGTMNLNLAEKGELNLLRANNPPFQLRFARDQIRINKGMIGIEVQNLMYKYYKLGFLRLI